MTLAIVPLNTNAGSVVPSPVVKVSPAFDASVSVPCSTESVTVSRPVPASTSDTDSALPVAVENTIGLSPPEVVAAGTISTGASLTGSTSTVIVFGVGSVSAPPLAVPPLSCTWKVNEASAAPLALAAGVQTSLPDVMSASVTTWPAVTAAPLSRSDPSAGSVVILTASKVLAGVSNESVKPKSAAASVTAVSSLVVMVLSAPAGASLTVVTLKMIVFGVGSRSTPPLAVPPSSCTRKVKLASPAPYVLAPGAQTSLPDVMSASVTTWPAVTAAPLSRSDPPAGSVVILIASRALAGVSNGSVKPKSAAANVTAVSSRVVIVLSAPAGASLTAVTLNVMVLGDWSRSTPPLAVPPSSRTWKVKAASALPLALTGGVQTSLPDVMSASATTWPALTATPLSRNVPPVGRVVIFTASKALAGVSLGSVKPKSAAVNAYGASSLVVIDLSAPAGASLTDTTWIVVNASTLVVSKVALWTLISIKRSAVAGLLDVELNWTALIAAS